MFTTFIEVGLTSLALLILFFGWVIQSDGGLGGILKRALILLALTFFAGWLILFA